MDKDGAIFYRKSDKDRHLKAIQKYLHKIDIENEPYASQVNRKNRHDISCHLTSNLPTITKKSAYKQNTRKDELITFCIRNVHENIIPKKEAINQVYKYNSGYDYFDLGHQIIEDLISDRLESSNTVFLPKLDNRKAFVNSLKADIPNFVSNSSNKYMIKNQLRCSQMLEAQKDQSSSQHSKFLNNQLPGLSSPNNAKKGLSLPRSKIQFSLHLNKDTFVTKDSFINECPISARALFTLHHDEGKIFILGGMGRKLFSECLVYDTNDSSLKTFKSPLFKRQGHVSVKVGPLIIIHGGENFELYSNKRTLSDTLVLDTSILKRSSKVKCNSGTRQRRRKSNEKISYIFRARKHVLHSWWS